MAPVLVTLNDLEGHCLRSFPICRPFQVQSIKHLCSILPDFNWQHARVVPQRQLGFLYCDWLDWHDVLNMYSFWLTLWWITIPNLVVVVFLLLPNTCTMTHQWCIYIQWKYSNILVETWNWCYIIRLTWYRNWKRAPWWCCCLSYLCYWHMEEQAANFLIYFLWVSQELLYFLSSPTFNFFLCDTYCSVLRNIPLLWHCNIHT